MSVFEAPLRQQSVAGEVPWLVGILVVLAVLGMDGVGRQQDGRLWWAVVLVVQDGLLHLGTPEFSVAPSKRAPSLSELLDKTMQQNHSAPSQ